MDAWRQRTAVGLVDLYHYHHQDNTLVANLIATAHAALGMAPGHVGIASWSSGDEPRAVEAREVAADAAAAEIADVRRRALGRSAIAAISVGHVKPGHEAFVGDPELDVPPGSLAEPWAVATATAANGVSRSLAATVFDGTLLYVLSEADTALSRWDVQDMAAVDRLVRDMAVLHARAGTAGRWWIAAPCAGEPTWQPWARQWGPDDPRPAQARWMLALVPMEAAFLAASSPEAVGGALNLYRAHPEGMLDLPRAIRGALHPLVSRNRVGTVPDQVLMGPIGPATVAGDLIDVTYSQVEEGRWGRPMVPGDA